MKPIICLPLAFFSLLFAGCQSTTVTTNEGTSQGSKLERNSRLLIVTPKDGSYEQKQYAGSGMKVVNALDAAFAKYAAGTIISGADDDTEKIIEAGKAKKCQYAVIAKITQWEDRATEWSGKRDKIQILIKILRISDGTVIRSGEVNGKSAWLTFGGDHPEDMLSNPIQQFVGGLY